MRARHPLLSILLVTLACEAKKQDAPPAAASPTSAETPAAQPAPAPPPVAAEPALPALPPPPAGMDQAKAAACNEGEAAACLAAARSIEPTGAWRTKMSKEAGDQLQRDVGTWARRACDLGSGEACPMASHFQRGDDQRDALEKGCALGDLSSCGDLGWSLSTTGNSLENRKRGIELLEKACRAGAVPYAPREPGLFCEQAIVFLKDKALRDPAKSKELLALKCQQGSKLECPCKTDEDCGGGDYFCSENTCDMPSAD